MSIQDGFSDADREAFRTLSQAQFDALRQRCETSEDVAAGVVLYSAGARDYDFILIESGVAEIVRVATQAEPEEVVATHPAYRFLGELNMMTGQSAYLTARMREAGRIHRLSPVGFRRLMAEDAELSDLILKAFLARRKALQAGAGALSIEILGAALSPAAHTLRNWAARERLPHQWIDIDTPAGHALADVLGVEPAELPVVVTPTATLKQATAGIVSEHIGLSYRPIVGRVYDVVIVGAGPGGLAATVYGASEGLDTMVLDAVAVGGQAAASSRIENYLGFPFGLTGADLTGRAELQAQKFGAQVSTPCQVTALHTSDEHLRLTLSDGTEVPARAVVIATGARYRTLPLERWADFEAAGIYYAATEIEARTCSPQPVTVVGGANSAGQAAIYLADRGSPVTLVYRGADLAAGMSRYLVDRVMVHPRIEVLSQTQVVGLHGGTSLEAISTTTTGADGEQRRDCHGLFCFIGASPATEWLDGIALDDDGFVLTDQQLAESDLTEVWSMLGRSPLPFETSIPGVFAVGDVRQGSMKRVAAAVGEGASAIRSVHTAIAPSA